MVFTSVDIKVLATEADGVLNRVEMSLNGENEGEKEPAEETISGNDSVESIDGIFAIARTRGNGLWNWDNNGALGNIKTELKRLIINEGVTSIREYAFL